jgi:hypothetical protein
MARSFSLVFSLFRWLPRAVGALARTLAVALRQTRANPLAHAHFKLACGLVGLFCLAGVLVGGGMLALGGVTPKTLVAFLGLTALMGSVFLGTLFVILSCPHASHMGEVMGAHARRDETQRLSRHLQESLPPGTTPLARRRL